MSFPPDNIGKGVMFWVVQLDCLSGQILLPRYLMNAFNNFDKTVREYYGLSAEV